MLTATLCYVSHVECALHSVCCQTVPLYFEKNILNYLRLLTERNHFSRTLVLGLGKSLYVYFWTWDLSQCLCNWFLRCHPNWKQKIFLIMFKSWDVVAVKRKEGNRIVGVTKTPLYVKMVKADLAVCVYLLTSNIQYQCKLGRRTKQSIGHFLLSISIFIWFIIYYIDIDEMDRQGNLIKAHVKCQIPFYIFRVFEWLDFLLYI